VRSTARRN